METGFVCVNREKKHREGDQYVMYGVLEGQEYERVFVGNLPGRGKKEDME